MIELSSASLIISTTLSLSSLLIASSSWQTPLDLLQLLTVKVVTLYDLESEHLGLKQKIQKGSGKPSTFSSVSSMLAEVTPQLFLLGYFLVQFFELKS